MKDALSPRTRALLAAARRDVPSEAARAAMWTAVSTRVATLPPSPVPRPLATLKVAALGGLIGGALVVGAVLLMRRPAPASAPRALSAPAAAAAALPATQDEPPRVETAGPATASAAWRAAAPRSETSPRAFARAPAGDALSREAALLGAARAALHRGDAQEALVLLETARALPERQLDPEARALEARARAALRR